MNGVDSNLDIDINITLESEQNNQNQVQFSNNNDISNIQNNSHLHQINSNNTFNINQVRRMLVKPNSVVKTVDDSNSMNKVDKTVLRKYIQVKKNNKIFIERIKKRLKEINYVHKIFKQCTFDINNFRINEDL